MTRYRLQGHVSATLVLLNLMVSGLVQAAPATPVAAAMRCTQEPARLERLACFDAVFNTPLHKAESATQTMPGRQPVQWIAAYSQENRRAPQDGALQANGDAGLMVTVAALGAVPPRPLLTVRCHNKITQLALMMPKPMSAERVRLTIATGNRQQQQVWRVRDDGYVLSGGRGLPAIDTIRNVLGAERLTLSADQSAVDGLVFDLAGMKDALNPLREMCRW
ncbi:type VI secretion system-associated protein VasI [Marinobacter sp. 1Y8]